MKKQINMKSTLKKKEEIIKVFVKKKDNIKKIVIKKLKKASSFWWKNINVFLYNKFNMKKVIKLIKKI